MSELRNSTIRHYAYGSYHYYNKYTDQTTEYNTSGYVSKPNYRYTGDNYPDWQYRIASGLDATTDMEAARYSVHKREDGAFRMYPGPYFSSAYIDRFGAFYSAPPFSSHSSVTSLLADSDEKAKKLFLKKAHEVSTHFQGGIFLGELREVLRQIRNPARALRMGLPAYRQTAIERMKGIRNRRRRSNIAAETWLEYAFGWAPLVSDVKSGAEALARLSNGWYDMNKRVTAIGHAEKYFTGNYSKISFGFGGYEQRYDQRVTCTTTYRGLVGSEPSSFLGSSSKLLGLSWSEVLPTVWELIPYSFLVDYFTNIGDLISAWSYQFFDKRWINRTQRTTVDNIYDSRLDEAKIDLRVSQGILSGASFVPSRVTGRYSTVSRGSYSGSLVPEFSFEIPGIGSLKWINIGALARLKTYPFFG
jgi:hypothetical protein